jgi:hypothetical protein
MTGFGFVLLADTLTPLFSHARVEEQAEKELEDLQDEIREYAQQTAPWADRTGAAREGLETDVYRDGSEVVLELYHTVDYGIWLETIQSGAFAVIMPTLETYADRVMRAVGAHETSIEEL